MDQLTTYDASWIQEIYIQGLPQRIAELLLLKNVGSLREAMLEAERIDLLSNTVRQLQTGGSARSSNVAGGPMRGRGAGRGYRGARGGRYPNTWTSGPQQPAVPRQETSRFTAGRQTRPQTDTGTTQIKCSHCGRIGHKVEQC